jgi:hypothetical protein
MELDLQSLFGFHVHRVLISWGPAGAGPRARGPTGAGPGGRGEAGGRREYENEGYRW